MIFQTILYQNGDIEIIKKEEEWQDFSCNEYEVFFFTNYFDEIKNEDSYGKIDLYNKYKSVVINYDAIRRYAGKPRLENKDIRGNILCKKDFINFDFRNMVLGSSLSHFERKDLEENLEKVTKKLEEEAKQLKETVQEELSKINI